MKTIVAVPLAIVLLVLAGACGDDETDEAIDRLTDRTGARGVAEALRVSLLAQDLNTDQHVDDVAVIQSAVDDLPGDPDVVGIEDRNGDGRDDDGRVEARVNDEAACVSVQGNGEVDVSGRACAAR